MIDDVVAAYVTGATAEGYAEDWDLDQLWTSLKQLYPVGFTIEELIEEVGGERERHRRRLPARPAARGRPDGATQTARRSWAREAMRAAGAHGAAAGHRPQVARAPLRDGLPQEGINLRAYAQRDPVVEYQREGFDMFATMMDGIKEETVGFLFNLEVQVEEQQPAEAEAETPKLLEQPVEVRAKGLSRPAQPQGLQYSAPVIDGAAGSGAVAVERAEEQAPALGLGGPTPPQARRAAAPGQVVGGGGPSRNAPCPCGSGRKYKRCHGAANND